MDVPQIFLISNSDLSDYDFQVLMDSLIRDLPAQKRHNFTLSISNITEAAVDRKHESIQQYIWLEAFKSGLLATLPAVGILRDDVEKLKVKLKRYQVIFGVDDESLELIAKDFKVSVEQLSVQGLAVGICFYFHQLLDEGYMIAYELVINLIIRRGHLR
ncbi:interferon-inducible GTPase 1-like protein [Cricetulus griseus]|uniref:Interferon-inducible GTPase 1-like protein n=2 Tax=Cricetulus griseus TaxID=10029 RepID=A0A061IJ70_CRIGR|nr:interferon-inducible GTPase 1-like protein [Cricetulus griseus]